MALFDSLPNELLAAIIEDVTPDVTQQDFSNLFAMVLTCRRFYSAAIHVLYAKAALRHPYLLAWAADTNSLATLTRMLDAGVSPNTQFNYLAGLYATKAILPRPRYFPSDPHRLFRDYYMVPDVRIYNCWAYRNMTSLHQFCSRAAAQGRCVTMGYAVWNPRAPDPTIRLTVHSPAFALHLAAAHGYVDAMRLLLQAGAFPDAPSALCGPLWRANFTADPASPTLGPGFDCTPLRVALYAGHDEAFWLLRDFGASLLDFGTRCDAVLHYAIELGTHDIVARLLDEVTTVAEVNKKDPLLGRSLLWTACQVNDIPVVRRLAALGADLDEDFGTGYTPLFDACLFGRVELAKELLALGASTGIVLEGPYGPNLGAFEKAGPNVRGFRPVDICAWLMQPPDEELLSQAQYWERLPGGKRVTVEELKGFGRELLDALQAAGAGTGAQRSPDCRVTQSCSPKVRYSERPDS
jgi:hypothetical protein